MIEDGTAVGSALATAVDRLRGVGRQEQDRDPAHRRPEQRRQGLAADRRRGRQGARHQGLHHRRRHARHGALPAQRPVRQQGLRADAGRHRRGRRCSRSPTRPAAATSAPPTPTSLRKIYAEIDQLENDRARGAAVPRLPRALRLARRAGALASSPARSCWRRPGCACCRELRMAERPWPSSACDSCALVLAAAGCCRRARLGAALRPPRAAPRAARLRRGGARGAPDARPRPAPPRAGARCCASRRWRCLVRRAGRAEVGLPLGGGAARRHRHHRRRSTPRAACSPRTSSRTASSAPSWRCWISCRSCRATASAWSPSPARRSSSAR